jgi:predicted S18 family serine protease
MTTTAVNVKSPAYAKVKTITSRSGLNAAVKHRNTLRLARTLLQAQDTAEAYQSARLMTYTIQAYNREISAWYDSDIYRSWHISQFGAPPSRG